MRYKYFKYDVIVVNGIWLLYNLRFILIQTGSCCEQEKWKIDKTSKYLNLNYNFFLYETYRRKIVG